MRRTILFLTIGLLAVGLSASAALAQQPNYAKVKEYRIERSVPPEAQACIECHRVTTPGVFADWAKSRHANANITCMDCHLVQPGDQDIAQDHEKYYSRSDCPGGKPSTRCRSPPS
jgi:hydroxylamine dehydrogenase